MDVHDGSNRISIEAVPSSLEPQLMMSAGMIVGVLGLAFIHSSDKPKELSCVFFITICLDDEAVWMIIGCTLCLPGLDVTRLFISLTAGAGTRCMSLLSSSPNLWLTHASGTSGYILVCFL